MRIVIQCAGSKHKDAGHLKNEQGVEVKFVAHPELCAQNASSSFHSHPDAQIGNGFGTWRELLIQYNKRGTNPNRLFRAAKLYKPSVYQDLVERYGWDNVLILSAGWGLVRSDFLIPNYDITFSNQAEPCTKRGPRDLFHDFNHLRDLSPNETIYFFGGKAYLPLFYLLTQSLKGRKVVYSSQSDQDSREGYEYVQYRTFTNWHYSCARDFMAGKVPR